LRNQIPKNKVGLINQAPAIIRKWRKWGQAPFFGKALSEKK